MPWFAVVIIVLIAMGAAATTIAAGKPREPISPGVALVALVINLLMIAGVAVLGSGYCG